MSRPALSPTWWVGAAFDTPALRARSRRLIAAGPTAPWAAGGLGLMLLAMFPANVHKTVTGVGLPWDDQLVPRTVLQAVFLAAVLSVVWQHVRARRPAEQPVP